MRYLIGAALIGTGLGLVLYATTGLTPAQLYRNYMKEPDPKLREEYADLL